MRCPIWLRHHLVDGNAGVNVRARGLLDAHAGQEGAAGARVIAGAIGPGVGAQVLQPADDLELFVHVRERRERGRQREVRAVAAGHHADGMVPFGT